MHMLGIEPELLSIAVFWCCWNFGNFSAPFHRII